MTNKEEFIEIYKNNIHRNGAEDLLIYLVTSDFFEAPASTRFHLNYPGGLCEHSLNVYRRLKNVVSNNSLEVSDETVAIVSLLHDLCKADFYVTYDRNVKNEETGRWEKVKSYRIEDQFPAGHGEKSCRIIEEHMRLTREEWLAIRWHMGGWDSAVKGGDSGISKAWNAFPIGAALHIADMEATYFDEKG